jgi:hypothetical protein
MLEEVDAQHALKPNRRTVVARLGVVGFDDGMKRNPANDGIHRLQ